MTAKPSRDGLYRAEDWKETNPDYEWTPPKHSRNGRFVEVDFPLMYDAGKQAEAAMKIKPKRGKK